MSLPTRERELKRSPCGGLLALLFLSGAVATGQKFPVEVYLLALVLLLRSGSVLLVARGAKTGPKS